LNTLFDFPQNDLPGVRSGVGKDMVKGEKLWLKEKKEGKSTPS